MIAIVDYGMGNLRSVEKALQKIGQPVEVTSDTDAIRRADRLILPGVGAFGAAMDHLRAAEPGRESLAAVLREQAAAGKPLLGICLGMQLLFTGSEELGRHSGLRLLAGPVRRFDFGGNPTLKIPHMGWNALRFPRASRLFDGVEPESFVYFVHGFHCAPDDPSVVAATCDHGGEFCAAIERENLFAAQFHPEKSGAPGLRLLENFSRI